MDNKWLVLGGWAINPDILRPILGNKSTYLDVNEYIPDVIDNDSIAKNWADIITEKIFPFFAKDFIGVVGWSMGAIIACAISQRLNAKKMVLVSATPSFCRRDGFKFGQRSQALRSMRDELLKSPDIVLKNFCKRCEFPSDMSVPFTKYLQNLSAGLFFLEHCNLLDELKFIKIPALVVHGKDDAIIPLAAGKSVADLINGRFSSFSGGHAFFLHQQTGFLSEISSF